MANLYKIFHPSIDFLSLHLNQVLFTIVLVSANRNHCYLSGRNVIYPVAYWVVRKIANIQLKTIFFFWFSHNCQP